MDSAITLPGRGTQRRLYCRVIQSPLAGVSDLTFRTLIRRWAPNALLFTEMINATSLHLGLGNYKITDISRESGPIGVQLFDYRPAAMAEAAKQAEAEGAFLIDINMGCPVKKIARKGGGSGLLRDPILAEQIVSSVANSVKIPVTVKTRLGWDKTNTNPVKFAHRLQEAGAQLLTLHGRTREQGFAGNANWEAIAVVKEALKIPVIANGDITSVDSAIKCLEASNTDGVMIGRGSLSSPWLIGQIDAALNGEPAIQAPSPKERIQLAIEYLDCLVTLKGDHGLLVARKHLNWLCHDLAGTNSLLPKLMKERTPSKAINLLEEHVKSMP
ncbi:tRNA dihydrouridine synthase DusB [Prochlorococcus sp. MIT 1300]|uniref:tRNA dihydrouridine synthase DusB n=1 Tax=Prochlorococcus sp. MIT 1300 TaxID=3096218 RepID=UPI0039BF039F